MFLQPSIRPASSRRTSRGFTLIELVVVVLIIGITAAIATPAIGGQVRERRARDTAQRIALLYSSARMRALGRGSAVLVRYGASGFTVLESIEGVTAATALSASRASCATQPGLGCLLNNWTDPDTSRQVAALVPNSDLEITVKDQKADPATSMDICFSPLGRSFISFVAGSAPTTPMVGATTIGVRRMMGATAVGIPRTVAVLPNGMARLGL